MSIHCRWPEEGAYFYGNVRLQLGDVTQVIIHVFMLDTGVQRYTDSNLRIELANRKCVVETCLPASYNA